MGDSSRGRPLARLAAGVLLGATAAVPGAVGQDSTGPEHPLRGTLGDLDFEFYGFLFGQAVFETRGTDGDPSLKTAPARDRGAETFGAYNATRLGLNLTGPAGEGAQAFANLEFDFQAADRGSRVRHAFVEWRGDDLVLLVGQTWQVPGQANPRTVNNDNLFNQGNLFERIPLVRVKIARRAEDGEVDLQVGLAGFFGVADQDDVAVQQGLATDFEMEIPSVPQAQLRAAWAFGRKRSEGGGRDPGYLAVGASAGRMEARDETLGGRHAPHRLVAAEVEVPIGPATLLGEVWAGEGAGFNTGIGQSGIITPGGEFRAVAAVGGFADLGLPLGPKWSSHLVFGVDDPRDERAGTAVALERNVTLLGNLFHDFSRRLTGALEVQWVRTERDDPDGVARNLRATVAAYLRF